MSLEVAAGAALGYGLKSAAESAGKEIAEKAVKAIVKRSDFVDKILRDNFKIEGQEMTILCPEGIQKYSISLTPKASFLFPKSVKFSHGTPRRIEIRQVRGLSQIPEALKLTTEGFEINLKPLNSGELYILDIEYKLDDHRFVDSLVDRIIPRDVPHDSEESTRHYEMSAQMKHLKVLRQNYYSVNLRDVDFTVDVAVHQDVKTTVPGIFRQQLDTLVEISKKKGWDEQHKLLMRHRHLQTQKYGGKEIEILQNLYELFTPIEFKKYVSVIRDFHYSDCMRGSDFYDTLPFPTWPKSMKIVSRTDLSLDKPAADGILAYKHSDFVSEIEKLFGLNKGK
jgi:hypothetical protein